MRVIVRREGRQLVYELSAKHHCALLSYAIQQIMKQGHETEVASVGAPLAAYFMVFHTILATRLRSIPSATPASLEGTARDLKVMAGSSGQGATLVGSHVQSNARCLCSGRCQHEICQWVLCVIKL